MIPVLVCRPLQYPDQSMAKATVRQLRLLSQPSLRVHCHSLSAAGYSCQRWKMSPSCWQHWHWQKSPCRAHSQLSNCRSTRRADSVIRHRSPSHQVSYSAEKLLDPGPHLQLAADLSVSVLGSELVSSSWQSPYSNRPNYHHRCKQEFDSNI